MKVEYSTWHVENAQQMLVILLLLLTQLRMRENDY